MRIRSIHATNLLSFGSLTLELRPGLNVIVGPNGVGKSNLVRLLRLVRLVLDAAVGVPSTTIDSSPYFRLGMPAPRRGTVALHWELNVPIEKDLVVAYVRALAASSVDRTRGPAETADGPREQELAERVRRLVGEQEVAPLLSGRLVLTVIDEPQAGMALAYEFDVDETTYHLGLLGSGLPTGWVAKGPATPAAHAGSGGQNLDLTEVLTSGEGRTRLPLGLLLPEGDRTVVWDIKTHPTGRQLPLTEELTRLLGASPDPSRTLPFALILFRVMARGLVLTTNLRRPPRYDYAPAEVGAPVALDDGGDLPLELYRLAVGDLEERAAYARVQEHFAALTGLRLELRVRMRSSPPQFDSYALRVIDQASAGGPRLLGVEPAAGPAAYRLHVVPVVVHEGHEVPIDFAGAGVWEALLSAAVSMPVPGRVVALDEPAVNLHPTWQRRLLGELATLDQALLITHSPYLVPAARLDDLPRIVRLVPTAGGPVPARLPLDPPAGWPDRWRQILAGSTDARSALFAHAVVLVEGDTEVGAFRRWFSDPLVTGGPQRSAEALDVLVLPVNGDASFGAYTGLLTAFAVPWAILADGPVLSPEYKSTLVNQLRDLIPVEDPPQTASFPAWTTYWRQHGVFTLADGFGGVQDEKDKSGEIEAFFRRMDPGLWQEITQRGLKSKVREGYAFAEECHLSDHPRELNELRTTWDAIVDWVRG